MALDTSIYGMIQPQQAVDPLAQYGKAISLQNMIGQNDLHQLQTGKLRKDIATDEAISAAVRTSGGDPEKIRAAFVGAGAHKELQAWEKAQLEAKEKNGAILKTKFETEKLKAASLRDDIVSLGPDSDMAAFAERAKALYGPDIVGRVKIPPVFNAEWQVKAAQDGKQFIDNLEKQKDRDATTRGQDMTANTALAGQNITVRGQDMTDARTRAEGAANRGVSIRGQDMTNARAVEAAGRDKFGQPFESTVGGVPRLVMQNKGDGTIVDAQTKQPVAGLGPKVGESAQKQQTGVANTVSALGDYRDALKTWSATDALSPDARAKMGTIYNNALLQAKEAFNLGVLNGPDYMILQQVLTDPASLKGGVTSTQALKDQATKLEEIMGRVGKTVTQVQTGNQPTGAGDSKKINGVEYVKINGQWFQR